VVQPAQRSFEPGHARETCLCLRVDIDTTRDARALPSLLGLLQDFDVKATIFVSTGRDDSARDLPRALLRVLRGRYIRRYGLDPLRSLLSSIGVEESTDWRVALDGNHELGLHGFRHRQWLCKAKAWNAEKADEMVGLALKLYRKRFGWAPQGFAAPGFVATPQITVSLERHGFLYTSNSVMEGGAPFRPEVDGRKLRLVEMPVSCLNVQELLLGGLTRQAALRLVENRFLEASKSTGYFCYYVHPSHEVFVGKNGLRLLLSSFLSMSSVWAPTMGEAARAAASNLGESAMDRRRSADSA